MTYQENNGDVQGECDHGVGKEWEIANVLNIGQGHLWNFDKESGDSVHDGASRSKVVERDERVHLELGRGQQALDHGKTDGLEHDSSNLEEETSENELDLSKGRDDNTNDDQGDISKSLEVWWSNAHSPSSEKDSDWGGGLIIISILRRKSTVFVQP